MSSTPCGTISNNQQKYYRIPDRILEKSYKIMVYCHLTNGHRVKSCCPGEKIILPRIVDLNPFRPH